MSLPQARKKRVADNGLRLLLVLGLLSTSGIGWADEVAIEQAVTFNIPQQRADLALTEFAEQADLTLIFPPELVEDISANELIGAYTKEEGAKILLAGTGLIPTFSNRVVLSIATDGKSAPGGESMNVKNKAGLGAFLAAVFSLGAGAQESAAPLTTDASEEKAAEEENALETITVIGIRQQLQQASAIERDADNIISAITADDFGDFPEDTLAEAIGRLSGVTIIEQEGEGRFIRIRGLSSDFAQVTLSNAQLGSSSANGDRSVALDIIPADLLSRAEVGKTLFPDTDHDSLGAKLDLRPLSAFDRRADQTAKLTFQGNYRQDA
ncbi:MAG: TonB-dependent receptor plug domain-containing protein, partial [Pseudomonadota bacterium]